MLTIADRTFAWGTRTYIMAILNITPDSFSGDGLLYTDNSIEHALIVAHQAVDAGADILDIGGLSTRPGAQAVSLEEEQARVIPVIQALARVFTLPISIDSFHVETVAAAIDAGAHIVNDVWGLRTIDGAWNNSLATLIAARKVPVILMHNRRAIATIGKIGGYYADVTYNNVVSDILGELQASVDYALQHSIPRKHLIIDPGLGFGKTPEQNLTILRHISLFRSLDLPILLGASRKSFIGHILNTSPQHRDEGTAAITAFAVQHDVDIVRVHNVSLNVQVAKMTDALVRARITQDKNLL